MRTKLATYAVAGALGLTGVAGAALIAPAVSYAATGDGAALESRVSSIKDALTGLVTDGTLTQAQADKVAGTLAESHPGHPGRAGVGGRGMPLKAAAEALGITPQELRAAAKAGKTLADVADERNVSQDALVDALVAAENEHLSRAVADGRLTQAQADDRLAGAEARITERLDDPIRRGHHR